MKSAKRAQYARIALALIASAVIVTGTGYVAVTQATAAPPARTAVPAAP